jgi:hypothetical protein
MEYQAYPVVDSTTSAFIAERASGSSPQPWNDQFYFVSGAFDAPTHPTWLRTIPPKASESLTSKPAYRSSSKVQKLGVPTTSSKDIILEAFVNERLEYIYLNDEASVLDQSQSRIALRGVVELVEDLSESQSYMTLDGLLSNVDVTRLRPITNVAFLRTSYHARAKLANWKNLYLGVYAHLKNSGQDPDRALRGLSSQQTNAFG